MMVIKKHEKLVDRLIAIICSAAIIAIVVGLLVLTRPSEVKADGGTVINGIEYSSDYKMQILNIVPEESYDELGPLFGDDQGAVSWKMLQEASKNYSAYGCSSLKDFSDKFCVPFLDYINGPLLSGSGYYICAKYNNQYFKDLYYNALTIAMDNRTITDLSGVSLSVCVPDKPDEIWNAKFYPFVDDDDNEVRDLFSYCVFGNSSMEGKVQYVVKSAKSVTKEDIDRSQLIYITCTSHNSSLRNIYDKLNNTTTNVISGWKLGSDYDMKADVALYLYMLNATKGKAVIIDSNDKNPIDGSYSNIAKLSLLLCGIERDQFVEDFGYQYYSPSDSKNYSYKGKVGGVKLEENTFNVYFRDSKLAWSSTMFLYGDYPTYLGHSQGDSSYPVYNATYENKQRMLNKFTYQFNSSNFMTSDMFNADIRGEVKDFDGDSYIGNTTSEALTVTYKNTATAAGLNSSKAIMYILGAHNGIEISDGEDFVLNVLEIEPTGQFRYNANDETDCDLIKSWFALSASTDCELNITHVTMNGFIGMTEDIRTKYDLVIVGAYTGNSSNGVNTSIFGKTYNSGTQFSKSSSSSKKYTSNGNDLTDKAYDKLLGYAKAGLPIVLDKAIYFGDEDVVEAGTNMMALRKSEFTKRLIEQEKVVYSNMAYVETTKSASVQEISGTLYYVEKPTSTIRPNASDYDGTQECLLNPSLLSGLTFKGNVNSRGDYTVKIYIDRNCDSLYAEDSESETPELVYYDKTSKGSIKDGVKWTKGETFNAVVKLPSALTGYIGWKVEVTDLTTGAVAITKGAFAVKPTTQKTITVLQIESDKEEQHINLQGDDFQNCFNGISDLIGMDIDVVKLTKTQFNAVSNKSEYLEDFAIIVLGLSDNYGNDINVSGKDNNLNSAAIKAIDEYIANGNSVLFTHDGMSYKDGAGSEAGSESKLNDVTKAFKTTIGIKSGYSLTDSLIYKLSSQTPFKHVSASGSTRNTNKVTQLNEGEITEYPYKVNSDGNATITVAETHGQYFALDLDYIRDSNGNATGNDVVVWYTLEQSNDVKADGKNYGLSSYFAATGQDAMNNYYIYSVGNITYSSAGHSLVSGDGAEMQLFVNTFVRAILSGNTPPEVSYPDAVLESGNQYTKYTYTEFTGDMLSVNYMISDPDMIEGVGQIASAYLFYDKDNSGTYTTDDVIIGYIKKDGSIVKDPLSSGEKSVVTGAQMTFDLWNVVSTCGVSTATVTEMKNKFTNNNLSIGILAKDSNNGIGYATLKYVKRDLFKLE
ncbi:MAG: DUF5057 domain-containing protein [Lachnospira sp.]